MSHDALTKLLIGSGTGPLFVHSDLFVARIFTEPATDRRLALRRHIALLEECAADRAVWMPAFNYDFLKTGRFDIQHSPCQVGPLGEHFRTAAATWRTGDPVFSVAGTQAMPPLPAGVLRLDPFGPDSTFAILDRCRATLLFYGAPFSSATILHYAERKTGGPLYRYDKIFRGTVTGGEGDRQLEYLYHVRPLNQALDYDWERLAADLQREGQLRVVHSEGRCVAQAIDAGSLCAFWAEQLSRDPLYLLDAPSRAWVEPALSRIGRRFELSDFEAVTHP